MPRSRPFGNLTAWLVFVALLELVLHRLIGRLFLSGPGCQSLIGCLLARSGPFLFYLSGVLALIVLAGGIAGHLTRGELLPRGVRITVTALGLVFATLVALTLLLGQMPERYGTHLVDTSFGFVLVLLAMSFVGARVPARARAGMSLLALATLFAVGATVTNRAGWLRQGALTPARLTVAGEVALLIGAAAAPLLLVPRGASRQRVVASLALAAGVTAFFSMALLGRYDLVQTLASYTFHVDVPPALSGMGAAYAAALFGYVTTLAMLLLGPAPARLAGYGLALIGIGGFQTASPVELAITLCGFFALATGLLRSEGATVPLGVDAWRALVGAMAAAVADATAAVAGGGGPRVEGETAGEDDVAAVQTRRRTRPVAVQLRRRSGRVRELEVVVGAPGNAPPDATIEPHESWLARAPEERLPLPRHKTGDRTFDRRLSVHGDAPLDEPGLRRRVLRHTDGTVTLWRGSAARYRAAWDPAGGAGQRMGNGASTVGTIVEVVDTLIDLVEAGAAGGTPAPPVAAG